MRAGKADKTRGSDSQGIPNKLYFRIGEVARLTGVKPYVLRYWEQEFSRLAPKKSGTNRRLYRRKDVELALEIKRLLYEKRYTIEGARLYLDTARTERPLAPPPAPVSQTNLFGDPAAPSLDAITGIRRELEEILAMLGDKK